MASKEPDFSQAAVDKAVARVAAQHPSVLYPAGAAILGGVVAALFWPAAPALIAATGGGLAALGGWLYNARLRRDALAADYVTTLRKQLADEHEVMLAKLDKELDAVAFYNGKDQLTRLQAKFDTLQSLLEKKLNPEEITYGRYLGMAEQVFLSAVDNVQRMVGVLQSIRTIDEPRLRSRITELEGVENSSAARAQELNSLRARLTLKREQLDKVDEWLAQNEQAMTQLDHTATAIAAMNTVQGHASLDMEAAMEELRHLASRAERYSLE